MTPPVAGEGQAPYTPRMQGWERLYESTPIARGVMIRAFIKREDPDVALRLELLSRVIWPLDEDLPDLEASSSAVPVSVGPVLRHRDVDDAGVVRVGVPLEGVLG